MHITEDASTSGALSPFRRDNLGPWLTRPELIARWDVLVTSKVDRVSRSVVDFHNLLSWCQEHGKSYVSVGESFDLSTPMGRMLAQILAVFAEFERERIRERARDARLRLRSLGRYPGGHVPFGWRAEELADGGWALVPDEAVADDAREMARMRVSGKSSAEIARWVSERISLTTHGKPWSADAVRQILRGPHMRGLLEPRKYAELRAALEESARPVGDRGGGYMLTRVAFCAVCFAPLYVDLKRSRGYGYYHCKGGHVRVRTDNLETYVEAELRARWGNQRHRHPVVIPGDDHSRAILETEQQLATVRLIPEIDVTPLEQKLEKLRRTPHEPDRLEWEDSGQTIAEAWESAEDPNAFLRQNNVVVRVTRAGALVDPTWQAAMGGWSGAE